MAELEKEWDDVARKVGAERARIASSQSEVMQRKEAVGREIAEQQLAVSSLRHESAALKQRLARLQSSLDKVEKDTREVEWRMQQRAGSAAGEAAAAAVPPAPPASSTAAATATAAAPPLASPSQLRPSSTPVAAAAAASSEQQHRPQVARPATARARQRDVSAMSDNEKYYYYMERNKGRLDLDDPHLGLGRDLGLGLPRGSTPPVSATAR